MFTWTETPLAEMWHHLRYLKSPSNVYNLLSGKIESNREERWGEPEKLKQRSYEISACIKQADEYYQAAETVGLATQPLLQFYGAQALAKAVILSNEPSTWLLDLKYHGLSTRPSTACAQYQTELQKYSDSPLLWEIEKEFGVTHHTGVFPDLCQSIGDTVPEKGEVLKFKDVIRIIPDIANLYHRHYGESSHCFQILHVVERPDRRGFETTFKEREDPQHILRTFPEFDSQYASGGSSCSLKSSQNPSTFGVIEKGTVAGKYFVRPLDCGIHKSFSVLYASMFILSNVVRYKPSFWMRVIEGEHSGSVSITEALCNLAKRRLPNDALEAIWQEEFDYGTPGRYT